MDWKDRLYNWEVNPPNHVWDRIVHDLDNEYLEIKNRLLNYEQAPPAETWNKIIEELEEKEHSPLFIPGRWNRKRVYRMAAAAVIAGFVILGIDYLVFQKPTNNEIATNVERATPRADSSRTVPVPPPSISERLTARSGQLGKVIGKLTEKKPTTNDISPVITKAMETTEAPAEDLFSTAAIAPVPVSTGTLSDKYDLGKNSRKIQNKEGVVEDDIDIRELVNSYLFLTDSSGDRLRLSSKLRNLVPAIEPNAKKTDILGMILGGRDYWKLVINKWQEKFAQSDFMPSSQNFMDIDALMKLLAQESK